MLFRLRKCRPPLEEKGRCGVPSLEDEGRYGVPSLEDEGRYGLPSLEELGLHTEHQVLWPGGETQALQRLHTHMESQVGSRGHSPPRVLFEILSQSEYIG